MSKNKNKLGRNEKCYCGSGEKYKNCCLNNPQNQDPFPDSIPDFDDFAKEMSDFMHQSNYYDATSDFSEFNNNELLKLFALLSILPQNHGKNIRLESITKQAFLAENGSHNLDYKKLENLISSNFHFHHMEDPPENPFTTNVITPAGNLTIFEGLGETDMFVLQKFIVIISSKPESLNINFLDEVFNSTLLLLLISDLVANSLGYKKYMMPEMTESNNIYFPSKQNIESKIDYLEISTTEVTALAESLNTTIDSLKPFLISKDDVAFETENKFFNPILLQPITKIDTSYILISPTTCDIACIHNILRQAEKYNCLSQFLQIYSEISSDHCNNMFKSFGYTRLKFEFEKSELPIDEALFMFDTNKLAFVLYIYDDGSEYNATSLLGGNVHVLKENGQIQDRIRHIYSGLKSDPVYKSFSILNIIITVDIGRPLHLDFFSEGLNWEQLRLKTADLEILYKSSKCNNLTLWNYTLAHKNKLVSHLSPLDNIGFFLDNDESFYTTDDKNDVLMVAVGNSLEFKIEAQVKFDEKIAIYPAQGKFYPIQVSRIKLPANLPIYSTKSYPETPFKVMTDTLNKEIWIKPEIDFNNTESYMNNLISELCITISFWLVELKNPLLPLIDLKGLKPIVINIASEDISSSYIEHDDIEKAKDLEKYIAIESTDHNIYVFLKKQFYYSLYSPDNLGEKVLLEIVLKEMAEVLKKFNPTSVLNQQSIEQILNSYMPLSTKKRLLVHFSGSDFRKDPINIIQLRKLSPYFINTQLDDLAESVSSKSYDPKTINGFDKKNKLLSSIVVHFYKGLRTLLQHYDFEDTLQKLLMQYEAAIFNRVKYEFEATSKIQCFQSYADIHSQVSKENKENNQISLASRCLIEHIVAEPMNGKKSLDITALDTALAFMYNIINWGFIGDEVRFNIHDVEISLLPSGRIGTSKSFQKNVVEPFYDIKFKEDIHSIENQFHEKFRKPNREKENDFEFESAFKAEFNISFAVFLDIVINSSQLAINEPNSIFKTTKNQFIKLLTKSLEASNSEIDIFLNNFSMTSRGKVENVKEYGFAGSDFYPWRYNRKLSFLTKPFIYTENENKEKQLWFSARAVVDFYFNLTNNIYSGRYNGTSSEMRSFIAKTNNKKGKVFTNYIHELLKENLQSSVYREIAIGPNSILNNLEDLGDFDVLIINYTDKNIIAVECKNINIARIPYEMHQELQKFISGSKPWLPKVKKREEWLLQNKNSLHALKDEIDYSSFSFESIIVTNEAIPLPFLKSNEIEYQFFSKYDLEQNPECIFK